MSARTDRQRRNLRRNPHKLPLPVLEIASWTGAI